MNIHISKILLNKEEDYANNQSCRKNAVIHVSLAPFSNYEIVVTQLAKNSSFEAEKWYARRDSNPRPSAPEADALSS